jgi:cytidylate kinase
LSERKLVIAIDGPAASGKSTTARLVAERMGYLHIDTGAMYRALTLKILKANISPDDVPGVRRLLGETDIRLVNHKWGTRVLLDGEDVTSEIRSDNVTKSVSVVSSLPEVRQMMVRQQRAIGADGGVVLEGRDIGTVVYPDADLKIFMVAGIEARAKRRLAEFSGSGDTASIEALKKDIEARDTLDSSRKESPLRKAPDAIEVDTSDLTIEQQVEFVVKKAREILERSTR